MSDFQLVLMEDDCASDARDIFSSAFKKETGGCLETLLRYRGATRTDEDCLCWYLTMPNGNYELRTYCDDPFFRLYKKIIK